MRQLLLAFSLLFTYQISAQLLTGARASAIVPDAQVLRYDGDQSLPQFIRLQPGVSHAMDDAPAYLKTFLHLPADHDFVLLGSETDKYGIEHRRYRQTVGGYPVVGGVYLFHGKDGRWTEANGELHLPESNTATAHFGAQSAIAKVIQDRPATLYGWEAEHPTVEYPTAELTWVSEGLSFRAGSFRLAYSIEVYRLVPLSYERLFIDAATGELIANENKIQTHQGDEDVPGQALTRYSGLRPINTTFQGDSVYVLQETGRGQGIYTYNALNQVGYPYADFKDDDNFWQNVNAQEDEYATDCHWGAEKFYDLLRTLDRNSLDDYGEPLESHVHYDDNYANAFWDGRRSTFGDGRNGSGIDLPSVTLDVVAHEFAHGLTDRTSDLIYISEFGALNESFSDIFGIATLRIYRAEDASWKIGADLSTDGEGIRNMRDPGLFGNPQTYRGDRWTDEAGVHTNSSVQNHWFYLLTVGGSGTNELGDVYDLPGLGMEEALEVAYRNNSFYLTETSNYADAGFNSVLAASSAFGDCSDKIDQVVEAWKAVGVHIPNLPSAVMSDFRVDGVFCSVADSVWFHNNSFGTSYLWDFGDGNTSTEINPRHIYAAPGEYTVSLTVTDCNDNTATSTQEAAVRIDPDHVECSFERTLYRNIETITDCQGVLYDVGGPNGRYFGNDASSTTIENPFGTPISLSIDFFRTEAGNDVLSIFDGDIESEVQLAVLSGIVGPRIIQASGPTVTLKWVTNDQTGGDGYRISWGDNNSNGAPNATFQLDDNNPLLNQIVIFQPDTDLPGPLTYDFGDGSPEVFADGPTNHAFNTAGTYQVRAIDRNCSAADTVFQEVIVQNGTDITITPAAIFDTLDQGETAVHQLTISNNGTNAGFYHTTFPEFPGQRIVSRQDFSSDDRITEHRIDNLPAQLLNPRLTFRVEGDFGIASRTAEITVEGEVIGSIGGSLDPRRQTMTIEPTQEELTEWLADGGIDVSMRSSILVATENVFTLHEVTFAYDQENHLTGAGFFTPLASSQSAVQQLLFDGRNLLPGLYLDTVYVRSSDVDNAVTAVPTSLLIRGVPRAEYSANNLDFGYALIDQPLQEELVITNVGSAAFSLDSLQIDNALFTGVLPATTLAPGESFTLVLDFTGASSFGPQQGELSIYTSIGVQTLDLDITVAGPPQASIGTNDLSVTLPANTQELAGPVILNESASTPLLFTLEIEDAASVPWLSLASNSVSNLNPNSSVNPLYRFDANGLAAGSYFATLKFSSNDPELENLDIQVTMIVTGTAAITVSRDTLDFGALFIGQDDELTFELTNSGFAPLALADLSSPDAQFSVEPSDLTLFPGASTEVEIAFEPTATGVQVTDLILSGSDADPVIINLRGQGLAAPLLASSMDTICITLMQGQDSTVTGANLSNLGESTLRYHFGQSAGKVLVWNADMIQETYTERILPLLTAFSPALTVEVMSITDPVEMARVLQQTDILFIPPLNDPDDELLATMGRPIETFMQAGGRVIMTGSLDTEAPLKLGLFPGSAVRANPGGIPIQRTPLSNDLYDGIEENPIPSTEATQFVVGSLPVTVRKVGRMYGQPALMTQNRGRGGWIYLGFTYQETSESTLQILRNAFTISLGELELPDWLQINPTNGEIAAGESTDHEITFSALDLAPGDYMHRDRLSANLARNSSTQSYQFKLTVLLGTDVEDSDNIEELTVYPNPGRGPIHLRLRLDDPTDIVWELTNIQGRKVTTGTLTASRNINQKLLDARQLASGVYLLSLRTQNGEVMAVRRVIIE